MDPDTKVIKDLRRLLNSDETPQPVDGPQKGSRPKVAKRKGKSVRRATSTSKESASVNVTWDASGHLYGVQIVTKRKQLSEDMVAEGPPGAAYFDDQVDVANKQSRSCLFSRTADGMQTQESFLEFLEDLNKQITARSDADVAAGGEPIERPVILCLDNHASRYSEEILSAASGQGARLGIRLFTEEPNTSGFLQSLDQYNAKLHRHYNKARDVWKTAYKAHHKKPCSSFGMIEFLKVVGGDATLGLPGMWFSWADPYDILTAWRRVGVSGGKLVPEMIDRTEFIDQPSTSSAAVAAAPSPVTRKAAAEAAATPEGMRSGSLAAERAKVAALRAALEQAEAELNAPFDPTAAGVLVPDVVQRPDKKQESKRKRLSSLHGSVTMRGLAGEAGKRKAEEQAAAEGVQQRKRAREEKRAAEAQAAVEREAAFSRCEAACSCGVSPCPWEGWIRCPTCGPKKGLCRVRACSAARAPLLLGHVPMEQGA